MIPGRGERPPREEADLVMIVRAGPGAMERVFGTLRRRAMKLEAFHMERPSSEADYTLLLRRGEGMDRIPERWIAELDGLVDVRSVHVINDNGEDS